MKHILTSSHPYILTFVASLLLASAAAQPAVETKEAFAAALIQFMEALPGTYGDEGAALLSSIDAMERGLARWNGSILAYEIAMAPEPQPDRAGDAAAAHRLLGAVYLERGSLDQALTQFNAALTRDPRQADVYRFLGFAYDVANAPAEATDAFYRAWTVDPDEPVNAYLFASRAGTSPHKERVPEALRSLAAFQQRRQADQDDRVAAPFLTLTLVEERPATDPMFPPVRYADGFALLRQGRYEEMISRFRASAASDPIMVDTVRSSPAMAQGIQALRDGQMAIALGHLTTAVRSAPDSSEAHRILATAYAFDEQYEQSFPEYEAAIRLNPQDERSRLAFADTLLRAEDVARCEQVLMDTVGVMPASGEAYWRLGQVSLRLNRHLDALTHFERAASLGPLAGSSRVYETLGRLYLSAARGDDAIEAFRRHVRATPNDGEAHRELGDAYRAQDRLDEALAELLAAVLIDPRDADAVANIGRIHFSAGRYDEAIAWSRRAVSLNRSHKDAQYTLATSLIRTGDAIEGPRQLEIFQRLQADAMAAQRRTFELNDLKLEAELMTNEGRRNGVVDQWTQVVELEPAVSMHWVKLGRALAHAGRPEEAIAALERALSLGAGLDTTGELVTLYELVGKRTEAATARTTYQRIKEERLRTRGAAR